MIHRIDSPHGLLARLFLVNVRDEPGQAGDHEQAVHHRRIESEIGQDRPHRPIDIEGLLVSRCSKNVLHRSRSLHMRANDAGLLGKLKQTSGARIVVVNTMTESSHALTRTLEFIKHRLDHAIK